MHHWMPACSHRHQRLRSCWISVFQPATLHPVPAWLQCLPEEADELAAQALWSYCARQRREFPHMYVAYQQLRAQVSNLPAPPRGLLILLPCTSLVRCLGLCFAHVLHCTCVRGSLPASVGFPNLGEHKHPMASSAAGCASIRCTWRPLSDVITSVCLQGFIVRSGLQYGVDFITYSDHPSKVHAEFGVLVQSLQQTPRLPWQDLEIVNRLSHQVPLLYLVSISACSKSPNPVHVHRGHTACAVLDPSCSTCPLLSLP